MNKPKKALFPVLALLGLCLCSCQGQAAKFGHAGDLTAEGDFKILQLADLHYNLGTDLEFMNDYVGTLYEKTDPDLVVLTGDQVLTGNRKSVESLLELLDGCGVPYAFAYGNHDYQGIYSADWLSSELSNKEKHPLSLYAEVEPELGVAGRSNSYINIMKDGELFYQVYIFDTGVVDATSLFDYSYDSIDPSQVEWFENVADSTSEREGHYVPSVFYFHVPLPKFAELYESGKAEELGGYLYEGFSIGETDSGLFEAALIRNCRAMFCGHDHKNSYTVAYNGMIMGFGVKTGPELYFGTVPEEESPFGRSFTLTGASLLTIDDRGLHLTHHYLSFDQSFYQSEAIYG